jgi:hypothetical protein
MFRILQGGPRGSWTRTGSLASELGLDWGKRRDELVQVMYIGVSHQIQDVPICLSMHWSTHSYCPQVFLIDDHSSETT